MKKNCLIYGCMNLGGKWNTSSITKDLEKKAFEAIFAAFENGITRYDHADIYTLGKSEQIFGKLLKENPNFRDKIQIQSKAGIDYHKGIKESNTYNFSKEYLLKQIEGILKRLNIDYLDMFLLHRPDPLTHPEELAETLLFIKEKGYTKSFGVSNMPAGQIKLLQYYSDVNIEANQIQLSLGHSSLLDESIYFNQKNRELQSSGLLEFSLLNNIQIQAWSPLDRGIYLTDHVQTDKKEIIETGTLLNEIAKKHDTNPTAIQLAWLFKLPYKISPIIGTTNVKRIKDSVMATTVELSREDWYNLWITKKGDKLP